MRARPLFRTPPPFPNPFPISPALGKRLGAGLALWVGIGLWAPESRSSCFEPAYDLEESISLEIAPGKNAEVKIGGMTRADEGPACSAWVSVPLSAFPSTRLATRPADVARSLRDVVEKMGATECTIMVVHENDTQDDLAEHELCLNESFRFGDRRVWSTGPESFCWEPEQEELVFVE